MLETAVGTVGALLAGVPVVPLNPRSGGREPGHILGDSAPAAVLAAPGDELPAAPGWPGWSGSMSTSPPWAPSRRKPPATVTRR
ncbi:hypothetical protein SGLAM104S_04022 [Streptomyces glaucescens]